MCGLGTRVDSQETDRSIVSTTADFSEAGAGYLMSTESKLCGELLSELASTVPPFLSPDQLSDMADDSGEWTLYRFESSNRFVALCQAIEAEVLEKSWGLKREQLRASSAEVDGNTNWLLLVRATQGETLLAGSISVANAALGPSETIRSALACALGDPNRLPAELQVSNVDRTCGLWDVMQICVMPRVRGSMASAWLQHGLYRSSCEPDGANRWISDLTRREFEALDSLGIPFVALPNLVRASVDSSGLPSELTFHHAEVANIRPSMERRITELRLEADSRLPRRRVSRYLLEAASISLDGCRKARCIS